MTAPLAQPVWVGSLWWPPVPQGHTIQFNSIQLLFFICPVRFNLIKYFMWSSSSMVSSSYLEYVENHINDFKTILIHSKHTRLWEHIMRCGGRIVMWGRYKLVHCRIYTCWCVSCWVTPADEAPLSPRARPLTWAMLQKFIPRHRWEIRGLVPTSPLTPCL